MTKKQARSANDSSWIDVNMLWRKVSFPFGDDLVPLQTRRGLTDRMKCESLVRSLFTIVALSIRWKQPSESIDNFRLVRLADTIRESNFCSYLAQRTNRACCERSWATWWSVRIVKGVPATYWLNERMLHCLSRTLFKLLKNDDLRHSISTTYVIE